MISRQDIQRLLHRPDGGPPILSVFLDMSVNSENKRTYDVFLNQRRAQYVELRSDRENHHREALGAAFERVQNWIDESFDEANKGVAIYTEIGGDWLEGIQFPIPVRNRTAIAPWPVIGPLAQVVETHRRHGVIVVDREHLTMLAIYLGTPLIRHEVETQPYPAPHDVQAGGYSAKDYQKRKAEEVRHFFKEFALEVAEFDRRYTTDDLVLLGTEDNTSRFMEFLPAELQAKVVHVGPAPVVAGNAEILERVAPIFQEQVEREVAGAVGVLRDRIANGHLAVAGVSGTLQQLQEGKLDTLVVSRDLEHEGARCLRCGFYLARSDSACPYCGGQLEVGVDVAEAMVRMAEEQEISVAFADPESVVDIGGVGGLLKF